jgi:hypothetical protein
LIFYVSYLSQISYIISFIGADDDEPIASCRVVTRAGYGSPGWQGSFESMKAGIIHDGWRAFCNEQTGMKLFPLYGDGNDNAAGQAAPLSADTGALFQILR